MLSTPIDLQKSLQTFSDGTFEVRYRGLTVWKHADDLRRLELALKASRATVVVETGTRWGGTAVWLADKGVDVITIDHDAPEVSEAARGLSDRVTYVHGDSADPEIVGRVKQLVGRRRCMVVLDSEHAASHVQAEIEAYGPMVAAGGYLVVEDGIFDLATDRRTKSLGGFRIPKEGGPLVAIERTLAADPQWTRDLELESLTDVSHNPAGWWVKQAKKNASGS